MFGVGRKIKKMLGIKKDREDLSIAILNIDNLHNKISHEISKMNGIIKNYHEQNMEKQASILKYHETIQDSIRKSMDDLEVRFSNIELALENSRGELRQIGNFSLRNAGGRKGQKIRCAFLVHAIESWDSQIDIWRAMTSDHRFEPLVFSINRRFPGDKTTRGEEETSAALDRAQVPHIRLGMEPSFVGLDILRATAPDVIFRQSQWEQDVPEAFTTQYLTFAHLCVMQYCTSITKYFMKDDHCIGGVSERAFDQYWHRMAWRVFCETEYTRGYFAHFLHSDPAKFVVTGSPKLAHLLSARKEPEAWPIGDNSERRFRVIWAPHHSIGTDWLGFGTFDIFYRDFLEFARQRPDIQFVLKPHPALFSFGPEIGAISQESLDRFLSDWTDLPNCGVQLGTYGNLFSASDILVTDGVSFLTEYAIFEKPLIFIDSGRHVPMNEIGDAALAATHTVRSFPELRAAVEHYSTGAAWEFEIQRKSLLKILFPCERNAVDIILDEIANGFDIRELTKQKGEMT